MKFYKYFLCLLLIICSIDKLEAVIGEFGAEIGKRAMRPLVRNFMKEATEGARRPVMVSNKASGERTFQKKTKESPLTGTLHQTKKEGVLYTLPIEPEPGPHSEKKLSIFTPDNYNLAEKRTLKYPTLLEINQIIKKDLATIPGDSLIRSSRTKKIIGYFDGKNPVFLRDKYSSLLEGNGKKIVTELESLPKAYHPYHVIGRDDRIPVDPTSSISMYPWSTMCFIQVQFPDNSWHAGSGSLVGKHHVLTAGHVISKKELGGWAKTVKVYPAINGWAHQPYGSYEGFFHSVNFWTEDENSEWDFGMIILNKDVQAKDGSTPGTLGVMSMDNENLTSQAVNLTGYPGEKAGATLWTSSGMITDVGSETFDYEIDDTAGDSGAPVWKYWSKEDGKLAPFIVGINAYEHSKTIPDWYTLGITSHTRLWNSATRISSQKLNFIKDWLKL